uniref:Uncharacterized protein n=1 Tax=Meloidogyne enterolobii TaxID=390850 RepID=A0A6V7V6I5_MELEN|nr:unnamed protein product [Meloidogyne enterolobii]
MPTIATETATDKVNSTPCHKEPKKTTMKTTTILPPTPTNQVITTTPSPTTSTLEHKVKTIPTIPNVRTTPPSYIMNSNNIINKVEESKDENELSKNIQNSNNQPKSEENEDNEEDTNNYISSTEPSLTGDIDLDLNVIIQRRKNKMDDKVII